MRWIFTTLIAALAVFSTTAWAEVTDRNFDCSAFNERGALVMCERVVSETSRGEIGADKVAALRHELEEHGLEMPSAPELSGLSQGNPERIAWDQRYLAHIFPWPEQTTIRVEISRDAFGGFKVRSQDLAGQTVLVWLCIFSLTLIVVFATVSGMQTRDRRFVLPVTISVATAATAGFFVHALFGMLTGTIVGAVAGFATGRRSAPVGVTTGMLSGIIAGTTVTLSAFYLAGRTTEIWSEFMAFCAVLLILELETRHAVTAARRKLGFWRSV